MKMQDKEFDDLFRSQLDGFEAEPSERVWTGIDSELDSSNRRKIWVQWMRVAAVLAIIVTAGWLFVFKQDKTNDSSGRKTGIAKIHVQPVGRHKTGEPVIKTTPEIQQMADNKALPISQYKLIAHTNTSLRGKGKTTEVKQQVIDEPIPGIVKAVEPEPVARVSPPIEVTHAVVPDKNVPLTATLPDENKNAFKTKPVAVAQVPVVDSVKKPKHKGIHSFGDLVNLVANKREASKIISDDDESVVAMVSKRVQQIKSEREEQAK